MRSLTRSLNGPLACFKLRIGSAHAAALPPGALPAAQSAAMHLKRPTMHREVVLADCFRFRLGGVPDQSADVMHGSVRVRPCDAPGATLRPGEAPADFIVDSVVQLIRLVGARWHVGLPVIVVGVHALIDFVP